MNNNWNKIIYKLWSPIYDKVFNSGRFLSARRLVFNDIPRQPHGKLLFVGVGTGADLEFFQNDTHLITAIDYSPDMIKVAKEKFRDSKITFLEMDAQNMSFPNDTFDGVIASLVLSVVPNPDHCMEEMTRVLKAQGEIVIFDKFTPKYKQPSLIKIIARPIIAVLGTDISVSFEDLYNKQKHVLQIVSDEPVMLNGIYRRIVARKVSSY